jgi:uncharacterized protein (TIGR02145 family)
MKKLLTLSMVILTSFNSFAQIPQKMSYQAVIRDHNNVLIANQTIGMQISILQGSATGTPVFVETQTPNTNANGLVTIEIGGGTPVSGTFNGIDWSTGTYFIKTETDPFGNTNYTITGTSQLLSVPYAFYANTTSNDQVLKQQIKILEDNLIAAGIYKLSDCEGNQYSVIKIGTQTWMKENLRTTKYNDCTDIPLVTNDADWNSLTTPAYCWYNEDISNKDTYGALYNGYTVNTGKLCPTGWHVPQVEDWRILSDPYRTINDISSEIYGYELMESGTSHWVSGLGTNTSGFTALPGGDRGGYGGTFGGIRYGGIFWASGIDYGHGEEMWFFPVPFDSAWGRMVTASLCSPKDGLSVRCIRD